MLSLGSLMFGWQIYEAVFLDLERRESQSLQDKYDEQATIKKLEKEVTTHTYFKNTLPQCLR